MAWIKQASVLVVSVLMAKAVTADEARANRPVTFVLPEPVVLEKLSLPESTEPIIEASVPLMSEILPMATTEAPSTASGASVINVSEAPEVSAVLPPRNVPTLPARTLSLIHI